MDIFRVMLFILVIVLLAVVALHDPIMVTNTSVAAPLTGQCQGEYTLATIALRCGISTSEIKQVNPGRDLDSLQQGDSITLPGKGVFPGAAEHCPDCSREAAGNASPLIYAQEANLEYTVREGDTLEGIARKFHTSVEEILRLNLSLSASSGICPGQVVFIP